MTEHDARNPQFLDPATMAAWQDLELRLDQVLIAMDDEEDGDHLIVQLEGHLTPYVQFASTNSGNHLRVELSGNAHLADAWRLTPDQCAQMSADGWAGNDAAEPNWFRYILTDEAPHLTNHLVNLLATQFGVPHPQLLTMHAFGPFTLTMDVEAALGLLASQSVVDEAISETDLIVPSTRDELHAAVGSVLRAHYPDQVALDEQDDYRLALTDHPHPVWVRVRTDAPVVEIFGVIVTDVHSRRQAAIEVGLLNRDHPMLKWTLHNRHVIQTAAIPGFPFAPVQLTVLVMTFHEALAEVASDLSLRTGGRVA